MRTPTVVLAVAVLGLAAACGGGSPKKSGHHHHAVIHQTPAATETTADTTSSAPAPAPTTTVTVTMDPSTGATVAPSTTAGAAITTLTGFKQFLSPSKNVGCEIDSSSARCDINKRTWSPPPKPASCMLDYGEGIQVFKKTKAQFVCAGDTAYDPSGAILAYGHGFKIGDLQCVSETSGMTCENVVSGHGFTISREGYHLS